MSIVSKILRALSPAMYAQKVWEITPAICKRDIYCAHQSLWKPCRTFRYVGVLTLSCDAYHRGLVILFTFGDDYTSATCTSLIYNCSKKLQMALSGRTFHAIALFKVIIFQKLLQQWWKIYRALWHISAVSGCDSLWTHFNLSTRAWLQYSEALTCYMLHSFWLFSLHIYLY